MKLNSNQLKAAKARAVALVHAIKRAEANQATEADRTILEWAAGKQQAGPTILRWSIERAASEFGRAPRTVAARLKQSGQTQGEDGKFSTAQVATAIYGDLEGEKLRKTKEDADRLALANATARGELVDRQDFVRRLEPVVIQMKQRILGSGLTHAEQDELLADLAKLLSGN